MLDRNNPKPLYIQLEDILREAITNGQWKPNTLIPSENELGKMYGLSRMTVRSVITILVKEGLLYRVQGKGTFVSGPKISAYSPAYLGIREQLEMQGYEIETKLSGFSHLVPDNKIRNILDLGADAEVLFIQRVRYANRLPVSIHRSYIPKFFCPNMTHERLESEQLCNILEKDYGLKTASVSETLESILATNEEAELLDIEKGYPLLLLTDINRTSSGQVYEYTKIAFRGDKVKLDFQYKI